MAVISVLWVVVGFSLASATASAGFIGDPRTFFMFSGVGGETHPDLAPDDPAAALRAVPAQVRHHHAGAHHRRVRRARALHGYLLFMVLFSLFIYAPLAHWTWHPEGFLRQWGVLDFAGGTVVHMSAGLRGARRRAGAGPAPVARCASEPHAPANLPFVMLGTGMLWFGWFGFNAGSALGASAQAALRLRHHQHRLRRGDARLDRLRLAARPQAVGAMGACIGAVVGLVAITPAAGFITVGQSIADRRGRQPASATPPCT